MIGEEELNRSRRIFLRSITALHVSSFVSGADAQPPTTGQVSPSWYPIVFAVLTCVFFFIGFLSVYIRHCSDPNPEFSGRSLRSSIDAWSRRGGLDPAIVESFPVFVYSSVKDIKIGTSTLECAVCLSEFEENESLRLLPRCSHVFHVDCIGSWLYCHVTCPVCRANLTAESVKLGDGTESSAQPTRVVNSESREPDDRVGYHVAIDIDDDRTVKSEAIVVDGRQSRGIAGKFPRPNSTGHSLAQLGNSTERYTLRLPDDVRKRIMAANGGGPLLKRAMSYDSVLAVGSGGESDRVSCTDRCGLVVSKSKTAAVR